MSLGPFDALFHSLQGLSKGNLHLAGLYVLLLLMVSLEVGVQLGRFIARRHPPEIIGQFRDGGHDGLAGLPAGGLSFQGL